jgi:hypothetical protein
MSGFSKMEKIAEGISDFGDFKAILFSTSNGRHFVRYEPLNSDGDEYLEWLRLWVKCSAI